MPIFQHKTLGRVLFLHIPKNGGSSVFWWLKNNGYDLDKPLIKMHPFYTDYQKCGSFDYQFMIARNPLERFCSMLRYRQGLGRGNVQNKDLNAFANDALNKAVTTGYGEGSSLDLMWRDLIPPQTEYYGDGVEVFQFKEGFEALQKRLGFDTPIPHVNISDGGANAKHLSAETISRIKEFYKDDYKTFGYEI